MSGRAGLTVAGTCPSCLDLLCPVCVGCGCSDCNACPDPDAADGAFVMCYWVRDGADHHQSLQARMPAATSVAVRLPELGQGSEARYSRRSLSGALPHRPLGAELRSQGAVHLLDVMTR